jgi:hypothetical protein
VHETEKGVASFVRLRWKTSDRQINASGESEMVFVRDGLIQAAEKSFDEGTESRFQN